jgi:hypothetical protein
VLKKKKNISFNESIFSRIALKGMRWKGEWGYKRKYYRQQKHQSEIAVFEEKPDLTLTT